MAQSRWIGVILLQALCVLVPLLWLLRPWTEMSSFAVGGSVLVSVLCLVAVLWWLRWKGMQVTWARARLLAEVARSRMACRVVPGKVRLPALEQIAELSDLPEPEPSEPPEDWVETWATDRIDHQLEYYRKSKAKAETKRARSTKLSTLMMDVLLAVSVAAFVIVVIPNGERWIRNLGAHWLEFGIGIFGVAFPLFLILNQTLRTALELNRRSARFARQIAMLERARTRLKEAADETEALQVVAETEAQLMSEVIDWYFEAENAERFFEIRQKREEAAKPEKIGTEKHGPMVKIAMLASGLGLLFLSRVILGRMVWVVGASGATLVWLSFSAPSDPENRKDLVALGQLLDVTGEAWEPDLIRAQSGCVVIVHGLHDGVLRNAEGKESRWMRDMGRALETRLTSAQPNIALLNWDLMARPNRSNRFGIQLPTKAADKVLDLAAIRPQALEVGDFLAFRLFQRIKEGEIDVNQPVHLIGHSAGGFVITRAALHLLEMKLIAPENLHVTILDTPEPHAEILTELPGTGCEVEFYVTSDFVRRGLLATPHENLRVEEIFAEPRIEDPIEQHSYAHQWFIETIRAAKKEEDGFGRSPFCPSR